MACAIALLQQMYRAALPTALALLVLSACGAPPSEPAATLGWFVSAGVAESGDGSQHSPFATLVEAEQASAPGDSIYLMTESARDILDGGIALKPDQKLLGWGTSGVGSAEVRVTNSGDDHGGVVVTLSRGNEVGHLHFVDLGAHGIESSTDPSGTYLHHLEFTGAKASEEIVWAVKLAPSSESVAGVRMSDCSVREGDSLGGVQVHHRGSGSGQYLFERNAFSDLGGRAYHLLTEDQSSLDVTINDSSADNIGLGDRNSDSILPHLRNRSQQTVQVSRFRYKNSLQVGSASNCGLEAFLEGAPFPATESWCDGCKLTLTIEDSSFENPVTDGIQLINFGSNSELHAAIRNTRVIGASPQQVGGGISLLSQNTENTGNRSTLLVEGSDIVGSNAYGVAISDIGVGHTSVVDLGGGELGSTGNNRIVGSTLGELHAINARPVARNNWWGATPPRAELEGERSTFESDPVLATDPRSDPEGR